MFSEQLDGLAYGNDCSTAPWWLWHQPALSHDSTFTRAPNCLSGTKKKEKKVLWSPSTHPLVCVLSCFDREKEQGLSNIRDVQLSTSPLTSVSAKHKALLTSASSAVPAAPSPQANPSQDQAPTRCPQAMMACGSAVLMYKRCTQHNFMIKLSYHEYHEGKPSHFLEFSLDYMILCCLSLFKMKTFLMCHH